MLTEKNILAAFSEILVPGIQRDLASMNLIQGVKIDGQKVKVLLASTALDENAQSWVHEKSVAAVKGLDSKAEVDMNVIMTGDGRFVEIQGTAEREPFKKEDMNKLITLAHKGIDELVRAQKKVLKGII